MAKHYVDKKSFRLEMIKSNYQNKLTPGALEMYELIVDGVQAPFTYERDADRVDCRSHAIEVFIDKWKGFDVSQTNAFSYFTSMAYNGIRAGWRILTKGKAEHSYSNIFDEVI